jgi:chromosomal replication initiator protein
VTLLRPNIRRVGGIVPPCRATLFPPIQKIEKKKMSNDDGESWLRVKARLRAEVGDDVFSSWFARMDLEQNADGVVRLSVPTRFLKSWIQSHYAERVLACWQAEQ